MNEIASSSSGRLAVIERQILNRLEADYEPLGYSFIRHPTKDQLPDFLQDLHPDAIAVKSDETIIFEILHKTGAKLRDDDISKSLAQRIYGRPGYVFTLVLGDIRQREDAAYPALSAEALYTKLSNMERLAASGEREASFILGWATLEAATRARTAKLGAKYLKSIPETGLVPTIITYGLIEEDDEDDLETLGDLHFKIAHGDFTQSVNESDLAKLAHMIKTVIETPDLI